MKKILALLISLVLLLAGCSGTGEPDTASSGPSVSELPADPAEQITTNYAECLDALNVTDDVVFNALAEPDGMKRGVATVDSPSGKLLWDVVVGNTGSLLTEPDLETTEILETVDC